MAIIAGKSDFDELYLFAIETIQKMGNESLKFYGKGTSSPPFDAVLVTKAELHLTASFQSELKRCYPEHLLFGQDHLGDGYSHEGKRYLWVFDPLDGVDNFQSGIPIWGMSLALYDNYWPLLGVFFMPVTKDMFHARAGFDAYRNDRPIKVTDRVTLSQESLLLTFSRFHQFFQLNFPGKIRDFGSTGTHICYVAMGRADAAITSNESFKDLAAVLVILQSAGGVLVKRDGSKFYVGDYLDGRQLGEHLLATRRITTGAVLNCLNSRI
ncbi:MAG: inositol monophosphatase [Desulfobacteraceae bacterium]|nr:inositol monophosphatase [Desulfobacteraceae bacterium]